MTAVADPIVADLRRIAPADRLAQMAASIPGRLILVIIFTAMLWGMRQPYGWQIGLCLALTSLLPRYRRAIILLATLSWTMISPPLDLRALQSLAADHSASSWLRLWPLGVAGVWLFAWTLLWLSWRFPKNVIVRRPVSCLILALVAAISIARLPLTGPAWVVAGSFALALAWYIWFFAYWLIDNTHRAKARAGSRAGFVRPFWSISSPVPLGKGGSYLDRCEAQGARQLARSQLKGIRLLLWAAVLGSVLYALNRFVYRVGFEYLSVPTDAPNALVPTYWMALGAQASGQPVSWGLRWVALISFFVLSILRLAFWGHTAIAVCRMAGFNVFRNTYRPLTATTIAEGYNRIYWYFKEMLVTFYFYPTFLRHFKRRPRLRIFMATVAAAGLGNFIYHFLRNTPGILRVGWGRSFYEYGSFALYALVLSVAIGLSQLRTMSREARREPPPAGLAKVRAIACVILFYLLIGVYLLPNEHFGVRDYGAYLLNLFRP